MEITNWVFPSSGQGIPQMMQHPEFPAVPNRHTQERYFYLLIINIITQKSKEEGEHYI